MTRAIAPAALAACLIGLAVSGSAQQPSTGLDEPCSTAFAGSGPSVAAQAHRLIPAGIAEPALGRLRGVVARSLLWRPGEVIKVCFRSGTKAGRARVARHASEWNGHANIRFDFGEVSDPRMCAGDNHEGIKIDFVKSGPEGGFWSAIGTSSRKAAHSMNLGWLGDDELPRDRNGNAMPEREARRITMHEFGHAIGLFHEHQSPRAGCAEEYYEEAVLAFGALRGWSAQQSMTNFRQLADSHEFNATQVDRRSIMHYSLPPWLFKRGADSPCVIAPNFELSDGDKAFVASVYPHQVASVPGGSTTRSGGGGSAAAAAALLDEYTRALEQAGIPRARIESLRQELGALLADR